jgi:hypothetical protein
MTSNTEFNMLFELTELDMHHAPSSVSRDVFAVQHHLFKNSPIMMLHLQDQLKSECDSVRNACEVAITLSLHCHGCSHFVAWLNAINSTQPAQLRYQIIN